MGDMYITQEPQKARLMKKQKGKCKYCGTNFLPDDPTEKHHVIKRSNGGNNGDNNLTAINTCLIKN